jgi:hypothetical protein
MMHAQRVGQYDLGSYNRIGKDSMLQKNTGLNMIRHPDVR